MTLREQMIELLSENSPEGDKSFFDLFLEHESMLSNQLAGYLSSRLAFREILNAPLSPLMYEKIQEIKKYSNLC